MMRIARVVPCRTAPSSVLEPTPKPGRPAKSSVCLRLFFLLALFLSLVAFQHPAAALNGTVKATVYMDTNNSGTLNAGDLVRGFITVQLYDSTGTTLLKTSTPGSGTASFTVPAGTYQMKVSPPLMVDPIFSTGGAAPDISLGPGTLQVTVVAGQTNSDNKFLVTTHGMAIICGDVKLHPVCEAGKDPSDPNIAGQTVNLYSGVGTGGPLVGTLLSLGTSPGFDFMVPPGTYTLQIVPAPGFASTDALGNWGGVATSISTIVVRAGRPDIYSPQRFWVCEAPVPPQSLLGGVKYYDLNQNGVQDPGEPGIPGVKIIVTINGVEQPPIFTDVTGNWAVLDVPEGATYSVCEVLPGGGWSQTGPKDGAKTADNLATASGGCWNGTVGAFDTPDLNFGNVCRSGEGGGGRTPGYWSGPNGLRSLMDGGTLVPEFNLLATYCLVNQNGDLQGNFGYSFTTFSDWLKARNSVNMSYQLSGHLAAMVLNVEAGFVDPSAAVSSPTLGTIAIGDLIALANQALCDNPTTFSGDPNRSYLEQLKDALDAANNNTNFVSAGTVLPLLPDGTPPCLPITYD